MFCNFEALGLLAIVSKMRQRAGNILSARTRLALSNGCDRLPIYLLAIHALIGVLLGVLFWNQALSRGQVEVQRAALMRTKIQLQDELSKRAPARSITSQLPRRIDAGAVLTRVQRLAAESSVTLINLAPSKDALSASTAGVNQFILDLQLSGTYPEVKNFMAQLIDQSSELWLARLQLKAQGPNVHARLTLQAWSIELPAEPAQPRLSP